MSQSGVSSLVSGDPSVGSFTVGRKQISLAKNKKQHKQQHQHHDEQQQQQQQQSHSGGGDRHDGKRRPRVDLKSQRPVHVHAAALQSHGLVYPSASSGANGGGGEEDTPDGVNLSLVGATGQRRRVVEVRTKNSRDAQMSASRHQHRSETQASGFNTKGGHLKAMIVLPKNEEKMKAREQLMQMHPHIGQVFRGLAPPEVFQQEPFNRILTEHAACMPYRRRNKEAKTVIQWGERKLMLLELEFLTQYAVRPGTVVIYANCAPATRMPYLSSLFPHVQFVLVDPVPLDFDESQLPNVSVKQQQFDDALATEFAATAQSEAKTLLFIANATSDSPNGYLAGAGDDSGYVDEAAFTMEKMTAQAHWHRLLNSAKSLLKFTLPWTDDKTKYLDGDIVLPIWSGPTSTETRLVPNGNYRDWSHRHYEEQLMHYNNVTRVSLHEHGVTAEGLDGCGDCTAEVFILERYLERYPNMLQIAVGSQLTVTPSASGPAVQLKFDTTRFKDPEWQARQKAKREKFLVTLVNDHDGQPLTEEQMRAAGEQFDLQQAQEQNVEMAVDESSAPSAAAAAASSSDAMAISSDATMGAAASSSSGGDNASMEDAAPSFELSSAEQLKLAVGKFSQELSRRITNGGTRTLATLNEKMVQKAAFSRKNRK